MVKLPRPGSLLCRTPVIRYPLIVHMPNPRDERMMLIRFCPRDGFVLRFERSKHLIACVFDDIVRDGIARWSALRARFDVNVRHDCSSHNNPAWKCGPPSSRRFELPPGMDHSGCGGHRLSAARGLGDLMISSGVVMKSKLLAVAGLVLISTAGQASAAIVEVTVNGTVTSSVDLTGIFGIVDTGNAYVGDSYVASIIFNPSLGETQSTSTYNTAEGGSADPTPNLTNPALSANVTINGVTVSINPINFGEFVGDNNENGLGISGQHYNVGYYSNNMLLNNCCNFIKIQEDIAASDLSIPLSLTTPFTYNVDSDPAASESAATFYLTDRDNNGVYEQFTAIRQYSDPHALRGDTSARRTSPLRHRPRRDGFGWLAQEAEERGCYCRWTNRRRARIAREHRRRGGLRRTLRSYSN